VRFPTIDRCACRAHRRPCGYYSHLNRSKSMRMATDLLALNLTCHTHVLGKCGEMGWQRNVCSTRYQPCFSLFKRSRRDFALLPIYSLNWVVSPNLTGVNLRETGLAPTVTLPLSQHNPDSAETSLSHRAVLQTLQTHHRRF